jgi:hypothetical protein
MLASTAESLKPNYPIPSRAAIEALLDARDPGGNAIIVVPLRWPSR